MGFSVKCYLAGFFLLMFSVKICKILMLSVLKKKLLSVKRF